jgi:hypothetical protein
MMLSRILDWWCARRDARQEIGALLITPVGPPHLARIGQLGVAEIEREWLRYRAEVSGSLQDLVRARARFAATNEALAAAEQRSRELVEPTEAELTHRTGGEERTAVGVIRDRRLAEHRRRCLEAEGSTEQLREEWRQRQAEVEGLHASVADRFTVARARAGAVSTEVARRRLAYLSHLVRRHPDGARIAASARTDFPECPEWTLLAVPPDLSLRVDA